VVAAAHLLLGLVAASASAAEPTASPDASAPASPAPTAVPAPDAVPAAAAPSTTWAEPPPESGAPPPRKQSDPDGSYTGLLTGAYIVAPLLAGAIGGALAEVETDDFTAVLAGSTAFFIPMGVHLAKGTPERAGISVMSMCGLTVGGLFAGAGAGYLENKISCDPDQNSECADRGIGTLIIGAAVGSIVGYLTSAVIDVGFRSSAPEADEAAPRKQAAAKPAAQVWVAPLSAPRRQGSAATHGDGLMLGLTLQL
jgi:hypothetical protein